MALNNVLYHGRDGVVHTGAVGSSSKVGYVQAWTVSESVEEVDITAMGDTVRTYEAGLRDSSVTIDAVFNAGDTGQAALNTAFTGGSAVTVTMFHTRTATAAQDHITGSLTVLTREISSSVDDMIRVKFTARGTMTITDGSS
jgi:hypothetical protein